MFPKLAEVRYDITILGGGMNQVTPFIQMKPGMASNALNFECGFSGGFSLVSGYERYDGQPAPSDAIATIITGEGVLSSEVAIGDTMTVLNGVTTVLEGDVVAIDGTVDRRRLTLTKVTTNTGDPTGYPIYNGATLIGTVVYNDSLTLKQVAIDKRDAANLYRADIAAVPGSGAIRGVFVYDDKVYAFRDDETSTYLALYVESAAGWVLVPFMQVIHFTAGTNFPTDGATLTQGGVTATVQRVCASSGDPLWVAGDTAGHLVITDVAGGHFVGGAATIGATTTITLSAVEADIVMAPGGHIETITNNFFGQGEERVYGCGGEDFGFEFDGTTLVPIYTGLTVDKPSFVYAHKDSLIFAVDKALVASSPGYPYDFTATNGAFIIETGQEITGIGPLPASETTDALGIWLLNKIKILYGTSTANFDLKTYDVGVGALPHSVQNLTQPLAFDAKGIIGMQTAISFGNFTQSALSYAINHFVVANRANFQCTSLERKTSQYRAFFNNGYGIRTTIINGKLIGSTTTKFPDFPYCAFDGRLSDGTEVAFFGAADGFVYQLDKGSSFDGDKIHAELYLPPNFMKSPRIRKRMRKASVELYSESYVAFTFSYTLGYGGDILIKTSQQDRDIDADIGVPQWDIEYWDSGAIWDGFTVTPKELRLSGRGTSISLKFIVDSDYVAAFTVNSILYNYSYGRGER